VLVRQLRQQIPEMQETNETESTPGKTLQDKKSMFVIRRNDSLSSSAVSPEHHINTTPPKLAIPEKFESKEQFVQTLWPLAERAAEKLDTTPQVIIAQAALETGWGQYVQKTPGGRNSYNLFNIKADSSWKGPTLTVKTLEYDGDVARQEKAAFRVYSSFEDSFNDYVNFIQKHGRYDRALQQSSDPSNYIRELHNAGYATDPSYANKIIDIMQRPALQPSNIELAMFETGNSDNVVKVE
jgi:flagellar protein FlgJ